MSADVIEDGFGSCWRKCRLGDKCSLRVVRPGKVQCDAVRVDGDFGPEWVDPCVWGD